MSWTERQRDMLEAMGVRVWAPIMLASTQEAAVEPPELPAPASPPALPNVLTRPEVPAPLAVASSRPAEGARNAAIARMDWPELQQSVAGCQACKLCEGRKNTVFGVGNQRAHWMIVGEAPGEQEDLKGEPFVGQAGKLLDSMLRALHLQRSEAEPAQQVYIANTLKCRPPRNRNPESDEMAACEPYLNRQIELVQPRIILAMGRFAVQSLLRSNEPIGKLRGRVHRYQGVPLVVTYHPAYLLRNLVDKARAWEDLCLARQQLAETSNS